MASNLVVARGGVEFVPPISLAFWRWTAVFIILLPFTYTSLKKNYKIIIKEYKKLFFLGSSIWGESFLRGSWLVVGLVTRFSGIKLYALILF